MHMSTPEQVDDDTLETYEAFRNGLRDKIVHTLTIWPYLSPSMLQVAIGTSVSSGLWHPILQKLIDDERVVRETFSAKSPAGRDQTYTVIRLTTTPSNIK